MRSRHLIACTNLVIYRIVKSHSPRIYNLVENRLGSSPSVVKHPPGIPLTKASDAELWCFLWSTPWINGWINNREACDLRHNRTHYDVIVRTSTIQWSIHPVKYALLYPRSRLFQSLSKHLLKSFKFKDMNLKTLSRYFPHTTLLLQG